MQVALIPPVRHLVDTQQTHMQLILPHMLQNTEYKNWYNNLRAISSSQYFILDNGAAEGVIINPDHYLDIALSGLVDEIALPDVLYDRVTTVQKCHKFINKYGQQLISSQIGIGYVAQGNSEEDALKGIEEVVTHWGNVITVIYIPRLLVKRFTLTARLNLASKIYERWPNIQIHFFGLNQIWPGEIADAAKLSIVRSVDTSMPYQFAYEKAFMSSLPRIGALVITRPKNYFDLMLDGHVVQNNITRLFSWAKDE